jgi:hypothetical protein
MAGGEQEDHGFDVFVFFGEIRLWFWRKEESSSDFVYFEEKINCCPNLLHEG